MLRVALGALVALMVPLAASHVVEGWNLAGGSFRVSLCAVLRYGNGVCRDLSEGGHVVVQGGRWCGANAGPDRRRF